MFYPVILPPIDLAETEYTEKTTYSHTIGEDEKERVYTVHAGAQFGVECSSVETPNNKFFGRITWYKRVKTASG